MAEAIRLHHVVALIVDLPDKNLVRGQVGTVVEFLADGVYEVEFVDNEGVTYASTSVKTEQMMVLHDRPAKVA